MKSIKLLAFVSAFGLFTASCGEHSHDDSAAKAPTQEELNEAETEIQELDKTIQEIESKEADLESALEDLDI